MLKLLLCAALAIHGWFSFISWGEYGYAGFFPPFAQANTTQIFSDLVIALSLVNLWVFLDVRRRGKPLHWFGLHLAGTAMFGSFAPMLYLLFRDEPAAPASPERGDA